MTTGSKELLFFLSPTDLVEVIKKFEICYKQSYYQMDITSPEEANELTSLLAEPSLGRLTIGDWNHSPTYLVTVPDAKICIEEIKLRKGGHSFSITQTDNPNSVIFKPSGIFDDRVLIAGSLTTISLTPYSLKTFNIFAKIIKQHSSKIRSFYVGSDAYTKLNLGWRLVTSASSPSKYNLAI